jgi:membrane-associated phospholipid phosphatase
LRHRGGLAAGRSTTNLRAILTSADGTLRRYRVLVLLAVCYAVYLALYLAIDAFSAGRAAHHLFLPGEEAIPFLPAAAPVYALSYFVPLLAVWKVPDFRRVSRLLVAMGLALGVSFASFLVYPCEFPRPPLHADNPAAWLLSVQYHLDRPYNVFPSLHVVLTWVVWLACRDTVRHSRLFLVTVVAISISTVFVKQHYVMDLVYGGALAPAAWVAAGALLRLPPGRDAASA